MPAALKLVLLPGTADLVVCVAAFADGVGIGEARAV